MKIKMAISLIMTLFMIVSTLTVVTADENILGDSVELNVKKEVFNGTAWVESYEAELDETLVFRITIIYDPSTETAEKATDLVVIDTLPDCLMYNFSTAINYGSEIEYYGQSWITGNKVYWNLTEDWGIELFNQSICDQDDQKYRKVEIFYKTEVIAYTDQSGEDNTVDVTGLEIDTQAPLVGDGLTTIVVEESLPGLSIQKKVYDQGTQDWEETTTVNVEDIVIFQIVVENTGSVNLNGIVVKDILPDFLCYIDSSVVPIYAGSDFIEWSISLEVGNYKVIELRAEAYEPGQGSNLASAEYDQLDVDDSADVIVETANLAPDAPTMDGPNSGLLGTKLFFTVNTTDPEGDDVFYYVTYSDANSGWIGPFPSGVEQSVNYTFLTTGEKIVKAVARDTYGHESGWGNELTVTISENLAPSVPDLSGDTEGYQMESLYFEVNSTDPEGDDVYYFVDFGDGNDSDWVGPVASGVPQTVMKAYEYAGEYLVRVKAKDAYDAESAFSDFMTVTILPQNPPNPPVVEGDEEGTENVEVTFTVNTTDPEGDQVSYYVDFGDGNNSGWLDLVDPGDKLLITYTYETPGEYKVKAKAKDAYGFESEYGEEHNITINEQPPVKDIKISIKKGKT